MHVIQASCYPMTSKTNCTTIVFKKFCITTRTRQGRSKPFLEREWFGFFVFGGAPRRTTKASAAHSYDDMNKVEYEMQLVKVGYITPGFPASYSLFNK